MKIFISAIFLIFFCSVSIAQKDNFTVKFKSYEGPFRVNFKFSGVIDHRVINENIGSVKIGINNRRVVAKLDGKFEEVIFDQVNKIIENDVDAEKIFFLIHELNIDERTTSMSEKGICRIEIEFAKLKDSIYYSLGTFSSVIEEGGVEVTKRHHERIIKGLRSCIMDFEKSDWVNQKNIPVEAREEPMDFSGFNAIPEKGMYATFSKMARNEPMEEFLIRLTKRKTESKKLLPKYDLKIVNKEDKKKRIQFISNGIDIFMCATKYSQNKYFVKSKHFGRYIYFEDRISNSNATVAFGLTGAIISMKKFGIVLDTTTGEVFKLSESRLYQMAKEYKAIIEAFKKTKRKKKDLEKAFLELNKKLSE